MWHKGYNLWVLVYSHVDFFFFFFFLLWNEILISDGKIKLKKRRKTLLHFILFTKYMYHNLLLSKRKSYDVMSNIYIAGFSCSTCSFKNNWQKLLQLHILDVNVDDINVYMDIFIYRNVD